METRDALERAYGGPLPDETWLWLVEKRYVAECEAGDLSVEDLLYEVRRLNIAAPSARPRRPPARDAGPSTVLDNLNTRMRALAQVIAWRAGRSLRVTSYRRRWLGGELLPRDGITTWINDRYLQSLPEGWPRSPSPVDATNFAGALATLPEPHKKLEWLNQGARTTQVWLVPSSGPLAALADLSEKLQDSWDWHPAHATNFVLTGEVPARPGVRGVTFRTRRGSDNRYGPYELMSVSCTIDMEVTPEELAAWWRGVRSHVGFKGRRPIGDKSVALALFALNRPEDSTFQDDMEEWNSQATQDWQFSDYRNYRMAARKAIDALNRPAAGLVVPD